METFLEKKALFFLLFFFAVFYSFLFANFNQLPSEYYGGDHYAHFGSALKIYNTGNPFISSHYYGEFQHYPWLTPLLIALFAKITFLDIFTAAIFFPVLIILFTIIITYLFGIQFFENKAFAFLLALTWAVQLVPSFHPSEFAKQLMIPLLALFMMFIYSKNEKQTEQITGKKKIIAGVIFGVAALQHIVTFVVAAVLIVCIFVLRIAEKSFSWKSIQEESKKFMFIILIGGFCAALFWAPLLVKYQGQTLNDWQLYSSESVLPSEEFVTAMFLDLLDHNNGVAAVLFSVTLFLIVFFFAIKNKDNKVLVPVALFSAGLIGVIHPYMTYPLFGISLGYYRFPVVFVFVKHLFLMLGIFYIWEELIAKKVGTHKKMVGAFCFFLIIGWSVFSFSSLIADFKASERYDYAEADDDLINGYHAVRQYIDKNNLVAEDEVTLTVHPDIGFFYNALTGRNVMVSRITHATPFVDHNERTADMAVILYGTNRTKAAELAQYYHLKYFFSEFSSIQYRYTCLKNWNSTEAKDDDISVAVYWCLQTDPKYKAYMKENGIETMTADVRLAIGDQDVPTKEVLVIKPEDLKIRFTEVFAYENRNGTVVMKLYELTVI